MLGYATAGANGHVKQMLCIKPVPIFYSWIVRLLCILIINQPGISV